MSKDYETMHDIQNATKNLDDNVTEILTRMYDRLDKRRSYASCMSTSVTLYIAMKMYGENPEIVMGTVQYQGVSYAHAWIELNGKIFDLPIAFDTKNHPMLIDKVYPELPVVNKDYGEGSVDYYPFQFGEMWTMTALHSLIGKSMAEYIDNDEQFDLLSDVCYILNINETKENLDKMRAIAIKYKFNDKEDKRE